MDLFRQVNEIQQDSIINPTAVDPAPRYRTVGDDSPTQEPSYNILGKAMTRAQLEGSDMGKHYLKLQDAQKQGIRTFGESISDFQFTDAPFIGDIVGVKGILKIGQDYKKLAAGEDISDEDRINIASYITDLQRKDAQGVSGMVGDVLRQMPWFGAEIGAYTVAGSAIPGLGTAAGAIAGTTKAGVTAAGRATARFVTDKILKKAMTEGLKEMVEKVSGKAFASTYAKTLGSAASTMIEKGSTLMLMDTAVNAGANILQGENALESNASATRRTINLLAEQDEAENISRAMGLGDRYIEYLSEMSGGTLKAGLAPVGAKLNKIAGSEVVKSLQKYMKDTYFAKGVQGEAALATDAVKQAEMAQLKKKMGIGALIQAISEKKMVPLDEAFKILKTMGYDGPVAEIGEERVGDFLRGMFGIEGEQQGDWGLRNAFKQMIPELDQLKTEAIAFAVPGLLVGGSLRAQLWARGATSQYDAAVQNVVNATKPDNKSTIAVYTPAEGDINLSVQKITDGEKPGTLDGIPDPGKAVAAIKMLSEVYDRKPVGIAGQLVAGMASVISRIATGNVVGADISVNPNVALAGENVAAFPEIYSLNKQNALAFQLGKNRKLEDVPAAERAEMEAKADASAATAVLDVLSHYRKQAIVKNDIWAIGRASYKKELMSGGMSEKEADAATLSITDADLAKQLEKEAAAKRIIKLEIPNSNAVGGALHVYGVDVESLDQSHALGKTLAYALNSTGLVGVSQGQSFIETANATPGQIDSMGRLQSLLDLDVDVDRLSDMIAKPLSYDSLQVMRRLLGAKLTPGGKIDYVAGRQAIRDLLRKATDAKLRMYEYTDAAGKTHAYRARNVGEKIVLSPTTLEAHKAIGEEYFKPEGVDKATFDELKDMWKLAEVPAKVRITKAMRYRNTSALALLSRFSAYNAAVLNGSEAEREQQAADFVLNSLGGIKQEEVDADGNTRTYYYVAPGGANLGNTLLIDAGSTWEYALTEESVEAASSGARRRHNIEGKMVPEELDLLSQLKDYFKANKEAASKHHELAVLTGRKSPEVLSHIAAVLGSGMDLREASDDVLGSSPLRGDVKLLREAIMGLPGFAPYMQFVAQSLGAWDYKSASVNPELLGNYMDSKLAPAAAKETLARWQGMDGKAVPNVKKAEKEEPKKEVKVKPIEVPKSYDKVTAENVGSVEDDALVELFNAAIADPDVSDTVFNVITAELSRREALAKAANASKSANAEPQNTLLSTDDATKFLLNVAAKRAQIHISDDDWERLPQDEAVKAKLKSLLSSLRAQDLKEQDIDAAINRLAKGIEDAAAAAEAAEEDLLAVLSTTYRATDDEDAGKVAYFSNAIKTTRSFEDAVRVTTVAMTGVLGAAQTKAALIGLANTIDPKVDLADQEAFINWARTPKENETPEMRQVREVLVDMPVASVVNLISKTRDTFVQPAPTIVDGKRLTYVMADRARTEVMQDHKLIKALLNAKTAEQIESLRVDGLALPKWEAKFLPEADVRKQYVDAARAFMLKHFGQRFAEILTPEFESVTPYNIGDEETTGWDRFGYFYSKLYFDYASPIGVNMKNLANPATRARAASVLSAAFSVGYTSLKGVYFSDGTLEALRNAGNVFKGVYPSTSPNPNEGKTTNVHMTSPASSAAERLSEDTEQDWKYVVFTGTKTRGYKDPVNGQDVEGTGTDAGDMTTDDIIDAARSLWSKGTMVIPLLTNDKSGFAGIMAPADFAGAFETFEAAFAEGSKAVMPYLLGTNWQALSPSKINKRMGLMVSEGARLVVGVPGGIQTDTLRAIVLDLPGPAMNGGSFSTNDTFSQQLATSAGRTGKGIQDASSYKAHTSQVVDGILTLVKSNLNLKPSTAADSYEKVLTDAVLAVDPGIQIIMTPDSAKYFDKRNPVTVTVNGAQVQGYIVELDTASTREVASIEQNNRPKSKKMPITFLKDIGTGAAAYSTFVAEKLKTAVTSVTEAMLRRDKTTPEQVWSDAGLPEGNPTTSRSLFYGLSSALKAHFEMKGHIVKSVLVPSGGWMENGVAKWLVEDKELTSYSERDGVLIPGSHRENITDSKYRTSMYFAPADAKRVHELIRKAAQATFNAAKSVGKSEKSYWRSEGKAAREQLLPLVTDSNGNTSGVLWYSFMDMVKVPERMSRNLDDFQIDPIFLADGKVQGTLTSIHRTPGGGINAHALSFLGGYVNYETIVKDGRSYSKPGKGNAIKVHPEIETIFGLDYDADSNTTHLPFYDAEGLMTTDLTENIDGGFSNRMWYAVTSYIRGMTRVQATEAIDVKAFDNIKHPSGMTIGEMVDKKVSGSVLNTVEGWKAERDGTQAAATSRDLIVSINGALQLGTLAPTSQLRFGWQWNSGPADKVVKHAAPALVIPGKKVITVSRTGPDARSDAFVRKAMVDVINIIIDDPAKAGALGLSREVLDIFATALVGQKFNGTASLMNFMTDWVAWANSDFGKAYAATNRRLALESETGFADEKDVVEDLTKQGFGDELIDPVLSMKYVAGRLTATGRFLNTFDKIPKSPGELATYRNSLGTLSKEDPAVTGISKTIAASPMGAQVRALSSTINSLFRAEGDPATPSVLDTISGKLERTLLGKGYDRAAKLYRTAALSEAAWQKLPEPVRIWLAQTGAGSPAERVKANTTDIFLKAIKKYFNSTEGATNELLSTIFVTKVGEPSVKVRAKFASDITVDEFTALLKDAPGFADGVVAANPEVGLTKESVMPLLAHYAYTNSGYEGTITSSNVLYAVEPAVLKSIIADARALPVDSVLPDIISGKYLRKAIVSASVIKDSKRAVPLTSKFALEQRVGKLNPGVAGKHVLVPAAIEAINPAQYNAAIEAARKNGTLVQATSEMTGKSFVLFPEGAKPTPRTYVFEKATERGSFATRVIVKPGAQIPVDIDSLGAPAVKPVAPVEAVADPRNGPMNEWDKAVLNMALGTRQLPQLTDAQMTAALRVSRSLGRQMTIQDFGKAAKLSDAQINGLLDAFGKKVTPAASTPPPKVSEPPAPTGLTKRTLITLLPEYVQSHIRKFRSRSLSGMQGAVTQAEFDMDLDAEITTQAQLDEAFAEFENATSFDMTRSPGAGDAVFALKRVTKLPAAQAPEQTGYTLDNATSPAQLGAMISNVVDPGGRQRQEFVNLWKQDWDRLLPLHYKDPAALTRAMLNGNALRLPWLGTGNLDLYGRRSFIGRAIKRFADAQAASIREFDAQTRENRGMIQAEAAEAEELNREYQEEQGFISYTLLGTEIVPESINAAKDLKRILASRMSAKIPPLPETFETENGRYSKHWRGDWVKTTVELGDGGAETNEYPVTEAEVKEAWEAHNTQQAVADYSEVAQTIEQWKKEKGIRYNPNDAYSRGEGIYHDLGAFNPQAKGLFSNIVKVLLKQERRLRDGETEWWEDTADQLVISAYAALAGKRASSKLEGFGVVEYDPVDGSQMLKEFFPTASEAEEYIKSAEYPGQLFVESIQVIDPNAKRAIRPGSGMRLVIRPSSGDILWAAVGDVYSGKVRKENKTSDLSEYGDFIHKGAHYTFDLRKDYRMFKDGVPISIREYGAAHSEYVGLKVTVEPKAPAAHKLPLLANSLAAAIEGRRSLNYNELGVRLKLGNFYIEDGDISKEQIEGPDGYTYERGGPSGTLIPKELRRFNELLKKAFVRVHGSLDPVAPHAPQTIKRAGGYSADYTLTSSLESVAELAAEQKHLALSEELQNATKVPDIKKALLKDWNPINYRLKRATDINQAFDAVDFGRRTVKTFTGADAAAMKRRIIETMKPDAKTLEMIAKAYVHKPEIVGDLATHLQAARADAFPKASITPAYTLISWQDQVAGMISPYVLSGVPGLGRVLMQESGYTTHIGDVGHAYVNDLFMRYGLFGDEGILFDIEREETNTSGTREEKGLGKTIIERYRFDKPFRLKKPRTLSRDDQQFLRIYMQVAQEAIKDPALKAATPAAAKKAIDEAVVPLSISPYAGKAEALGEWESNDTLLRQIIPTPLADRMIKLRNDILAKERLDMARKKLTDPKKRALQELKALEKVGLALRHSAMVKNAAGNWEQKTISDTWTIPGYMVQQMYENNDGITIKQQLIEAKRRPESVTMTSLVLDTKAKYDEVYGYASANLPGMLNMGDRPHLGYKQGYAFQMHGAGFFGIYEQDFLDELKKGLGSVSAADMETHRTMVGVSTLKDGTSRGLEDVSDKMLQFLFNLKRIEYPGQERAIADIRSGKHDELGIPRTMNYRDVVDTIHEDLKNRLMQRMVDKMQRYSDPILDAKQQELIANPLALLKALSAEKETKGKYREVARATRRKFFKNAREAYQAAGLLPANFGIVDSFSRYTSELSTSLMYTGMLNQMVLMNNTDGTPIIVAEPMMDYTDPGIIKEATWVQHAKQLAQLTGHAMDPKKTSKENIRVMVDTYFAKNDKQYAHIDSPYNSIARFHVFVRKAGEEPVVDMLASGFKGGEAVNMLQQVLNNPWSDPWDTIKHVENMNAWMKVMSMQASFFFPVSAIESIVAASGGKAMGQVLGIDNKAPSLFEVYKMWSGGHPYYQDIIKLLAENGSKLSRQANPLNLPVASVEQGMQDATAWVRRTFGDQAGSMVKGVTGLPKWQSHMIFDVIFNTTKIWMAADRIAFERNRAAKLGIAYMGDSAAIKKWANVIDMAMGGDNHWRQSYLTPTVRRFLNLTMFSFSWTKAAWDIGGGGILTGPVLKNHLKPYEAAFIFGKNWPSMAFWVLFVAPATIQFAAWMIAQAAPDPEDERLKKLRESDSAWMMSNEVNRQFYADITPIVRLSPFYKGDPTGARRFYTRFGKQGLEPGNWIESPWKTFTGKLSQVARLGVEQATGESAGSNFDLGFKDQGLSGIAFDKDGAFMGSRLGMVAQKFLPFSVLGMMQTTDVTPMQAIAPVAKGISFNKASNAYYEILKVWADKETYSKIYSNAKIQANLEALGTELLRAAEMNGYDPKKVMDAARAAVLKDLYTRMMKNIDKQDLDGIEEVGRSISRVNGTLAGALRSVQARNRLAGKGSVVTPEQREALRQAFSTP